MNNFFLCASLLISIYFVNCSSDNDDNDITSTSSCKVCEDFINGGTTLEICDNGDDTAMATVSLSGLSLPSQEVEIESGTIFEELSCNDLVDLEINYDVASD